MIKEKLSTIFNESDKCKDHDCIIDKNSINYIFKPDLGLKDLKLKKSIFGHIEQPQLCDCIINTKNNQLIILEIKCGKVTKSVLKEIQTQLENVATILKKLSISFDEVVFIYKSLDTVQLKKEIIKIRIDNKTLRDIKYINQAILI